MEGEEEERRGGRKGKERLWGEGREGRGLEGEKERLREGKERRGREEEEVRLWGRLMYEGSGRQEKRMGGGKDRPVTLSSAPSFHLHKTSGHRTLVGPLMDPA